MLEQAMTILAGRMTDAELQLGAQALEAILKQPGVTDQTGELGLTAALAMYVKHREALGDYQATQRIFDNLGRIKPQIEFRSAEQIAAQHAEAVERGEEP